MKKIKFILPLLFAVYLISFTGCSNQAKDGGLKWYDNLENAEQAAQKENKPIFVDFTGSDWCVWCKKLNSEVFTQDAFINYAKKNLILVKIDFPENIPQSASTKYYNQQLAQRFGVQGFPTVILLSSSGTTIAQTGYQPGGAENYVQYLKTVL